MAARIVKFIVRTEVPDTVTDGAVERYIRDAIREWCYNSAVGFIPGPDDEHGGQGDRMPGPLYKIGDKMSVSKYVRE